MAGWTKPISSLHTISPRIEADGSKTIFYSRSSKYMCFEQRKMSNADFRFLIINHYYSNFKMLNSGSEPAQPERRTTQVVLLSPRRGHHDQERMSAVDAPNNGKRIRCRQCGSATGYKCTKCSSSTCAIALCRYKSGGKQ